MKVGMEPNLKVIPSLVLHFLITTSIFPKTSAELGSEDRVHQWLSKEVLRIPVEQFVDDQVLFQRWHAVSNTTQYWHPNIHRGEKHIYERSRDDKGAQAVILNSEEDLLERVGGIEHAYKQTYVVLRAAPDNSSTYYPLFAYLRNARANETCSMLSGGGGIQKCIEWDSWELRTVEEPVIWKDCSSSIFLSCGFNVTVFGSGSDFKPIIPITTPDKTTPAEPTVTTTPADIDLNSEDFTNSSDYDFFDDLHGRPQSAMSGRSLGLESGAPERLIKLNLDLCINLLGGGDCQIGNRGTSMSNSMTQPHPIQYAQCTCANDPKLSGKANYRNYQPVGKIDMSPYRLGVTAGTFNSESTEWQSINGKMYAFGPGALDVFKAEGKLVFGKILPDDRGTMGAYSAQRVSDPNSMINGVLIPIDRQTAFVVRFGLSYPATFSTPTGIPDTRGFVIHLKSKNVDLFYPDAFTYNNLMLNQPVEKPMEGKIQPIAQWAQEKDWIQKGLLLPRRWGPSIFIRSASPLDVKYGKFEDIQKKMPSIKVVVVLGVGGRSDNYYALEESLPKQNQPIRGVISYNSKMVKVYALTGSRPDEVDYFFPESEFILELVTFKPFKAQKVNAILRLPVSEPSCSCTGMDIYFPAEISLNVPELLGGTLTRQDKTEVEGQVHVDKQYNPFKFIPMPVGAIKRQSAPGELRYPTYIPIGSLNEPVRYNIREELGYFTPDLKNFDAFSVTIYVLGVDKLDILISTKPIYGKDLLPDDKGTAGTYTPLQVTASSKVLHGVLIPVDIQRGAFLRDGIAYPAVFKPRSTLVMPETLGFFGASMKKQIDFFYPDSYITFNKKKRSPYQLIEGMIAPDPPLAEQFSPSKGKLLPRIIGPSPFISLSLKSVEGSFQDDKQESPPGNVLVIAAPDATPDEFYALDDILPDDKTPETPDPGNKGKVTTPTRKIPIILVPSGSSEVPDLLEPSDSTQTVLITFIPTKTAIKPFAGLLLAPKNLTMPPKIPVDIQFSKSHGQPFPSTLVGLLKTADGKEARGLVMFNTLHGPSTFYPTGAATFTVTKKPLGFVSVRYPTFVPLGDTSEPIKYLLGETSGVFKPDDPTVPQIPAGMTVAGVDKADVLFSQDPVFGSVLPKNKGSAGSYIPNALNAKPIHGVAIPISDKKAYFIRDGIGYTVGLKSPKMQGFLVPVTKSTIELFYPDSFVAFNEANPPKLIDAVIIPENPKLAQLEGKLLTRKETPSVFIRKELGAVDGQFQDDAKKYKPANVLFIPATDGSADQFYPIDDVIPTDDSIGPVSGVVSAGAKKRPVTVIPGPNSSPDKFFPDDEFQNVPASFTPDDKKLNPVKVYFVIPKGAPALPKRPVEINIVEKEMPSPANIPGYLKTQGEQIPGSVIISSPSGPHTFIPKSDDPSSKEETADTSNVVPTENAKKPSKIDKEDDASASTPGIAGAENKNTKKYPNYLPTGVASDVAPVNPGVTVGNFVPDKENNRQPVRVSVHVVGGPNKPDTVESQDPIFVRDLPFDRATEGTYTPEGKPGTMTKPIHGILIPVDKNRGYFFRDGVAYPASFSPKLKGSPVLTGFATPPVGGKVASLFYPDTYFTWESSPGKLVEGQLKGEKPVDTQRPPRDGKLILRKTGPSIFIPSDVDAVGGEFQDEKKKLPRKVIVVLGNGKDDEFYPIDDLLQEGLFPSIGTITTPSQKIKVTAIPSNSPGAPDEIRPSEQVTPKPVEISIPDIGISDLKAVAILPADQKGPITKPTQLALLDENPSLPPRSQATITLPNKSTVDGLLVTDTPSRGPYTFYPGEENPAPSTLRDDKNPKTNNPADKKVPKKPQAKSEPVSSPNDSEFEITGGTFAKPNDNGDGKKPALPESTKPALPESTKPALPESTKPALPESTKPALPESTKPALPESTKPRNKEYSGTLDDPDIAGQNNRKPGTKSPYPEYVQYGFSTATIEYKIGVTLGTFTPDKKSKKPFTATLNVIGINKLDLLESVDPIFGKELPNDVGTAGTYLLPVDKTRGGNVHGVVTPIDERNAYLIRDGISYTAIFVPSDKSVPDIPGFVVQSLNNKREAQHFVPDSYVTFPKKVNKKTVLIGTLMPDEETTDFFESTPGKLLVRMKGPSIFIPMKSNAVEATFENADGSPPKLVIVIPGNDDGKPDEFYPIDDLLPPENHEPVKGVVKTPTKSIPVTVIPYKVSPDELIPADAKTEPKPIKITSNEVPLDNLKVYLITPTEGKGPLTKPVQVEITKGKEKLSPRVTITLTMPNNGPSVSGLLVADSPEGPFTFYPGMKDPAPSTGKPKETPRPPGTAEQEDDNLDRTTGMPNGIFELSGGQFISDGSSMDTFKKPKDNFDGPEIAGNLNKRPQPTNYQEYVQYGASGSPVEYDIGVTSGSIIQEVGKKKRFNVMVHVIGIDKLDLVESEEPLFGKQLPDSQSTVVVYTPADENEKSKKKPIRGAVVPINEYNAYIIRDVIAYTASFISDDSEDEPIRGFVIQSLGNTRVAEHFVPESYIKYRKALGKKRRYYGSIVPDKEVEDFFPVYPGQLISRPKGPSIFIPENVGADEGTFQDAAKNFSPSKVMVVLTRDASPPEYHPVDDLVPKGSEPVPGSITTSEGPTPVIVIPNPDPEVPDQILVEEKAYPKAISFKPSVKLSVAVIKAFTSLPKKESKLSPPKKPMAVTIVDTDIRKIPLSFDVSLSLATNDSPIFGLLVSNSPNEFVFTFYPGMSKPDVGEKEKSNPKSVEVAPIEKEPVGKTPGRKPKTGLYPTYVPLGISSDPLEFISGPSTGSFIEDDNPTKSHTITFAVLGVDRLDVVLAPKPIFGAELPDDRAIPGTYTTDKPAQGQPQQKPIHGVIIPVDPNTGLFIRDGLSYPSVLSIPDKGIEEHGFFVPLLRRPVELFYPDSISAFEPIIEKLSKSYENVPIRASVMPDPGIDMFTGSTGKILLNKLGTNVFFGREADLRTATFYDDSGKLTVKYTVLEGNKVPSEFYPADKPLQKLSGPVKGKLVVLANGPNRPPKEIRATVVSLPLDREDDPVQYKLYPDDLYVIKNVEITSKDPKNTLNKIPGYLATPMSQGNMPQMDVIVKQKIASPRLNVVINFDDSTATDGVLAVSSSAEPHSFIPMGKAPPSSSPTKAGPKKQSSPSDSNWELSGGLVKKAETEETNGGPNIAGQLNKKPKTSKFTPPIPLYSNDDEDWPSNISYEPSEGESGLNDEAAKPQENKKPSKPEKAINAVILPFDTTDGNKVVKGKIPPTLPKRGGKIYFIPYKSEDKDSVDYFRGHLRIPGYTDGDLTGRLDPPNKASMPPIFVVDPELSEMATFVSQNNPREKVYGYVLKLSDKQYKFRPDDPSKVIDSSTGAIKRPGKKNLIGILKKPGKAGEPWDFLALDTQPKSPVENSVAIFYPDLESIKPIKGKVQKNKGVQEFFPDDPASIDYKKIPIHGLIVYEIVGIAPDLGFIKYVDETIVFESDPETSMLAEFRPDNDNVIFKGVLVLSVPSEAGMKFLPSSQNMKPKDKDQGIMEKGNSIDAPMTGSIKVQNGELYFVHDKRVSIQVSFYPDLEDTATEATYIPPKQPGQPGEFRLVASSRLPDMLPSPGQLIPKIPRYPQVHGVLQRVATGLCFVEDPADKLPEYEVGLVPLRLDKPELLDISSMSVSVRGTYFEGISEITLFIPMSGVMGQLVANKFAPTDPKAVKFEGFLTLHEPKTTNSGESYKITFVADYNGLNNNPPTEFNTGVEVVFFPLGSIAAGIPGKVVRLTDFRWAIVTNVKTNYGRWKPPAGVQVFMFDEKGQIVPHDASLIWFKQQEREAMTGKKIKGGYYKGTANVNVIIPDGVKSGASFTIIDAKWTGASTDMIHGKVYPIGRGEILRFLPDDESTAHKKVKGKKVIGSLELDESLSVNGKTPDNGVAATLEMNELEEFIITPETKGTWGFFVPGKKISPRIVVMVFEIFKVEGSNGGPESMHLAHEDDEDTFGVVGVGRSVGGVNGQIKSCDKLKKSYFLHEEGVVLEVCMRKKNDTRKGYYPFVEVNDEDTDDLDNVRPGAAYQTASYSHLFVTTLGVKGEFRVRENSGMESMVKIPGIIMNSPSTKRLVFKPDDLNILLEEVQGNPVSGFFKSALGTGEEGLIPGTLTSDRKGTLGKFEVEVAGEYGLIFLTGKERIVAGKRGIGRTFDKTGENHGGKVHGIMFETGGVGTFLPQQPDVSSTFTYKCPSGSVKNEPVLYNPQFQLIHTETSFSREFRMAVKQKNALRGKLMLPENNATVPAVLSKSRKIPLAFTFTSTVPYKTGWLATRNDKGRMDIFFIKDDAIDIYQHPGWKTQYLLVEPGIMKTFEDRPFYGLGNCPNDPNITITDFKKSFKSEDDVIWFFLRVLRTHCLSEHFEQVKRLLVDGILETAEVDGGVVLRMKSSYKLLSRSKLSRNQTERISAAFEMAVLSQVYADQISRHNNVEPKAPDGSPISRSAYFFMKMISFGVKKAKEVIATHFIRVMRNFVTTINSAMTKLDQDRDRLDRCKECGEDIVLVHNDKKLLTALSQFITHHVRYITDDADAETRFKAYYNANKQTISRLAAKKFTFSGNDNN